MIWLKDCKLYWPAWNQGIPFTNYGYTKAVEGDGYLFKIDPEMDSWFDDTKRICMPIATSVLYSKVCGKVPFTSFTILTDGRVQVNLCSQDGSGYSVNMYPLEDLYFEGETYSLDE